MITEENIAQRILSVALERGKDKSTCPSEIARMLFPQEWRKKMDMVMDVARDLHANGKICITQQGKAVDIQKIKGPVRIKLANAVVD